MNKVVTKKGVTYLSSTGEVIDCLFCRIQKKQEPSTMVYEDADFVVFHTIKPASHLHLLVTPRIHIQNVHSLKGQVGADLVTKLVEIGKVALGEYSTDCQFSFHIPPLNSIDHLHLHAIASPSSMNFWGSQKYRQDTFFCQSAEMVIAKLLEQERLIDGAGQGNSSKL
jgi:diadenosine tetraphosphate (Ap4A) HIT family hydrolase